MIGGYTAPKGSREELGALLLGYFDDGELRYAGKVGTGFDRATLRDLGERLAPLRRDAPPFADAAHQERGATWVEPELVAAGRLHRVDARRAPAPSALPRACATTRRPREVVREDDARCIRAGRRRDRITPSGQGALPGGAA